MVVPEPVVSVIVPAYNAVSTLGQQLDALARQQPPVDWEILVCDNGSTDGTRRIVADYATGMPRLRWVDAAKRRGPSAARNTGAGSATGAFLAFCDADDVVADDWLASLLAGIGDATAIAGIVDTELLSPRGQSSVSWSSGGVITKPWWPRFAAAASSGLMVRAAAFRSLGGFDETLLTGEDIDLCWRLQLAGGRLAWSSDAIVHVRKRVGLLPIFRQAYSYAAGDRQLMHKYGALIDDHARGGSGVAEPQLPMPRPRTSSTSASSGRAARLVRLATREGMANASWRAGEWLGSRFSRPDLSGDRLALDAVPGDAG